MQRTVTSLLHSPQCKATAHGQFPQVCHLLTTSSLAAVVAVVIATAVVAVLVAY
jgi:hypothetical protein